MAALEVLVPARASEAGRGAGILGGMPPPIRLPFRRRLAALLARQEVRFVLAGGWNTAFGYGIYVTLYYLFHARVHYLAIAVVANILAITMAYATHKLFVFRTRGNVLREYLRFYGVYGLTALLGLAALPISIEILKIDPYVAPLVLLVLTVAVSYVGHKHFSFRPRAPKG